MYIYKVHIWDDQKVLTGTKNLIFNDTNKMKATIQFKYRESISLFQTLLGFVWAHSFPVNHINTTCKKFSTINNHSGIGQPAGHLKEMVEFKWLFSQMAEFKVYTFKIHSKRPSTLWTLGAPLSHRISWLTLHVCIQQSNHLAAK